MIKAILTISFIGCLAVTASAQYFHRYKALPEPQKPLLDGDSLSFYPEYQHRDLDKLFQRPENREAPMKHHNTYAHEHYGMPNHTPQGYHHLKIYKPDETVKHSLLITPPPKRRSDVSSDTDE